MNQVRTTETRGFLSEGTLWERADRRQGQVGFFVNRANPDTELRRNQDYRLIDLLRERDNGAAAGSPQARHKHAVAVSLESGRVASANAADAV